MLAMLAELPRYLLLITISLLCGYIVISFGELIIHQNVAKRARQTPTEIYLSDLA